MLEEANLLGAVELTVVHDDFDPESVTLQSISGGWPMVLASLKSFLETDEALRPSSQGAAR